MKATNIPSRVPLPFANSGSKNAIPTASQIGITPGAASLTDGFPPLTRTPLAAGGVPPSGKDFNGILNLVTAVQQWQSAGGLFTFDSTFSASVVGYPKGAILANTAGTGLWLSLVDDNTVDPDANPSSANWASLNPGGDSTQTFEAKNATVGSQQVVPIAQADRRYMLSGAGGTGDNVLKLTVSTTLSASDSGKFVSVDAANAVVTLPTAAQGVQFCIHALTTGVTIAPPGGASLHLPDGSIITTPLALPQGATVAVIGPYDTFDYRIIMMAGAPVVANAAASNNPVAYGQVLGNPNQAWVNETSNRALGTTYTNSTGAPIMVIVTTGSVSSGTDTVITVDGVAIRGNGSTVGNVTAVAIVKPGSSYSASANGSLTTWMELR